MPTIVQPVQGFGDVLDDLVFDHPYARETGASREEP